MSELQSLVVQKGKPFFLLFFLKSNYCMETLPLDTNSRAPINRDIPGVLQSSP